MPEGKSINIFGTNVSLITQDSVFEMITIYNFDNPAYICFPNVYIIVQAYKNPIIAKILNSSTLNCMDGKPLELYARAKGYNDCSTVSGYWLMRQLLNTDLEHYYYGASESTLKKMLNNIKNEFPNAKINGFKSPPFVTINEIENNKEILQDINEINNSRPHIIWVGISSPKQDALMYHFNKHLDYGLMIGVGAVFNYISGDVKFSPEWVKKLSLRWAYRVIQEPFRLGGIVIKDFSFFIYLILKELIIWCFRQFKLKKKNYK